MHIQSMLAGHKNTENPLHRVLPSNSLILSQRSCTARECGSGTLHASTMSTPAARNLLVQ